MLGWGPEAATKTFAPEDRFPDASFFFWWEIEIENVCRVEGQ
jgi:hypothetical protein